MKYKIIIFIIVGIAVLFALYFIRDSESLKTVYYYEDPTISLKDIRLKVIYFVPKNREGLIDRDWRVYIEGALEKIKEFHEFQFLGFSNLNFDIYPQPVVGLENDLFYDSGNTDKGNPHALRAIDGEIKERVFMSDGDLFYSGFSNTENEYAVNIYIYEGVGASAAKEPNGAVILSVDYLTREDLKKTGVSILYHEIAHTLGIPDKYDNNSAVVYSDDIMGEGRRKPLEDTYIADETKYLMGL